MNVSGGGIDIHISITYPYIQLLSEFIEPFHALRLHTLEPLDTNAESLEEDLIDF